MNDKLNTGTGRDAGLADTDAIKKSALIIATLNSFITPFMGSAVNVALPQIAKDLQVDAVLLS